MKRMAVPFTPVIRGENNQAAQAAEQLNSLIERNAAEGWDFVQLEDVTSVKPVGCLSFSQPTMVTVQIAVFEQRRA